MPFYTELGSDTFVGTNQNPIDPTKWTLATGDGDDPLQRLSNVCQCTTGLGNNFNGAAFTGATFPPGGQYAEVQINRMGPGDFASLYVLLAGAADFSAGYECSIARAVSPDGFTLEIHNNHSGTSFFNGPVTISGNDILRVEAFQGNITAILNGVTIVTAADPQAPASGVPALELLVNTADLTTTTLSNFSAGSISATAPGPTPPFLGSVRVVTSAPAGNTDPFIGTVQVVGSAPAGVRNPYLGQVKEVSPAPAGNTNPLIGQVVVVSSAPAGDPDPYLGSVVAS